MRPSTQMGLFWKLHQASAASRAQLCRGPNPRWATAHRCGYTPSTCSVGSPLFDQPPSPPREFALFCFFRLFLLFKAFVLDLFRAAAFFKPRLSDFILLSTTLSFAPFGTLPFIIDLPPPPFLIATTWTLRSSCFASFRTSFRICPM